MRFRWRYLALWPLAGACARGELTAPEQAEHDSGEVAALVAPGSALADALLGGCFQPSGNIYMVGLPGLKAGCTGNSHTSFAWLQDGIAGVAGPQGPQGPTGAEGPLGPAGPAGATGPVGPQGLEGEAGATGAQGPAGHAGETGDVGPQGPLGPRGAAGPAGVPGPAGSAGADGLPGAPGQAGANGADGQFAVQTVDLPVTAIKNEPREHQVSCPAGYQAVGGGWDFRWIDSEDGVVVRVIFSTPSTTDTRTWRFSVVSEDDHDIRGTLIVTCVRRSGL